MKTCINHPIAPRYDDDLISTVKDLCDWARAMELKQNEIIEHINNQKK